MDTNDIPFQLIPAFIFWYINRSLVQGCISHTCRAGQNSSPSAQSGKANTLTSLPRAVQKQVFSFNQNFWADLKYIAAESSQLNAWGRAAEHFSGLNTRTRAKMLSCEGSGYNRWGAAGVSSVAATHESHKPLSLGALCQRVKCVHPTM